MRVVALVLFVLALFVAIYPQFYNCQSHGFAIKLPKGTIPMRCLYTAHAQMALGIMVAIAAVGLWFLREKETRTILSILGIVGGFLILMTVTRAPGIGIGICVNPDMPCVVYMRPAIYTVAPLIMAASAVGLAMNLITLRPGMRRRG
ncbi:MAG: DUF4418 family protein [Proteobacteria bacterium]|nr:DUF4418 family protein [Pseudomonadota bacterium]